MSLSLLFLSFDDAKVRAFHAPLQTLLLKKLIVDATLASICDKTCSTPPILSHKVFFGCANHLWRTRIPQE